MRRWEFQEFLATEYLCLSLLNKLFLIPFKSDDEFGTNCNNLTPSLEYQTRTKIIFDLDNLDPADKVHLKDNSISSYYLSANMDLVAFRIDYEKRWRHSYKDRDTVFFGLLRTIQWGSHKILGHKL